MKINKHFYLILLPAILISCSKSTPELKLMHQVTGAIEPKQLAGGIFEALITTCMGLIVAIPSLYFFAIFKNRVDEFTGEASLTAEELVTSFKTGNQKE